MTEILQNEGLPERVTDQCADAGSLPALARTAFLTAAKYQMDRLNRYAEEPPEDTWDKSSEVRAHWEAVVKAVRDASAPAEAEQTKRTKGVYVGAPACFALEAACQDINRAFGGFGCYLVGSALERPDWRDVDVRYIMSDEEFDAEFPHTRKNGTWEFDPKWILLSVSISERLSKLTGLPIDFQFQPQTHANERHKGRRNALGMTFKRPDPEHDRILAIGAHVDERLEEMMEKTGLEGDECSEFVVLSEIVAKAKAALHQEDTSNA